MKSALLFAALALPVGISWAASAEELATSCAACHGAGGAAPIAATYPILAGQYPSYLAQAMKDYRSGKRKNLIMSGQAKGLSDDDIRILADYFGAQESPLYTPSIPGD